MLSLDRREFARLCVIELKKAHELIGMALPPEAKLAETAEDMAYGLPQAIRTHAVTGLFRMARMHYARVPDIRALRMAWDNHMRPRDEPTPADTPRLEAPRVEASEAQYRHLAAVRTALAMRKGFAGCQLEDWMLEALEDPPSRDEVEAFAKASGPSLEWYRQNPTIFPEWGKWLKHYDV